jgi:hypothetical protein
MEENQYLEKIKELKDKLPSIIDDFIKYYIFSHKNPDYTEYQQMFENIKNNLNGVNSELSNISNDVNKKTIIINKKMIDYNKIIEKLKKKNDELKEKLGTIEEKNNSSHQMMEDYKILYENSYLQNFSILFSIFFIIMQIRK